MRFSSQLLPSWKLDSTDTKVVNLARTQLKSGAVVTCTAYTYGKNPTSAGKKLAMAQAATTCAAITKGLKKVTYKTIVLPEKSAPATTAKASKGQAFRVDISIGNK